MGNIKDQAKAPFMQSDAMREDGSPGITAERLKNKKITKRSETKVISIFDEIKYPQIHLDYIINISIKQQGTQFFNN